MFEDFKKAVLNSYTEKKISNQLSDNLLNPTKAQLRKECLLILKNRYLKKDDETIKAFFDPTGKFDNHELSISKFDLEDFKALQKFLLGQPGIRKEENIKLLAWLIDFEPRPYTFGGKYNTPEKKEYVSENEEPINEPILNLPTTTGVPWGKIGVITFLSILLVLLSIKIFSSLKDIGDKILVNKQEEKVPRTAPLTSGSKHCMYWADDHYESIACSQKIKGSTIIALDKQKLNQLKRITRPDTLSKKDLAKTWYVKINKDSIEFYTDSGSYPLDSKKRLKPLTIHMLNKYPNGYNIYKN